MKCKFLSQIQVIWSKYLPTSFQQPLFAPKQCSYTLWMFWMIKYHLNHCKLELKIAFYVIDLSPFDNTFIDTHYTNDFVPIKKCSTWNNLYIKSSLKGWLIPDQMWWSRWGSRTRLRSLSGPWDGRPTQSYSGTFCRNVYTTKVSSHQTREQPCDAKNNNVQKN